MKHVLGIKVKSEFGVEDWLGMSSSAGEGLEEKETCKCALKLPDKRTV